MWEKIAAGNRRMVHKVMSKPAVVVVVAAAELADEEKALPIIIPVRIPVVVGGMQFLKSKALCLRSLIHLSHEGWLPPLWAGWRELLLQLGAWRFNGADSFSNLETL